MAFPFLSRVSVCVGGSGIQPRLEYEIDTYKYCPQDFFHPRAHALGVSRVAVVSRIEELSTHETCTRNTPEG